MTPADVIRGVRGLLFERGWIQNASMDRYGRTCAAGAIGVYGIRVALETSVPKGLWNRVLHTPEFVLARECIEGAARERGARGLVSFNDVPGRTFDEIVDLFDRAEKIAEAVARLGRARHCSASRSAAAHRNATVLTNSAATHRPAPQRVAGRRPASRRYAWHRNATVS